MTSAIINLDGWFTNTPAGRYALAWQQQQYDEVVQDIFGLYALQLGTSSIAGLHNSRISHTWLASQTPEFFGIPSSLAPSVASGMPQLSPQLIARTEALPFSADQFDLIVLPHTLEASHQPHRALQEVHRVLRPEGRLIISGFNPMRIWGIRPGRHELDWGESVSPLRLRKWLHPLGYEVNELRTGCCVPGFQQGRWIRHLQWADHLVTSSQCFLGGIYLLIATKHVQGSKMLALHKMYPPRIAPVTA